MSSALCEKTKSYVPGIVVTLGKCHESHSKERKDKNNDKYFHTRVLFLLEPSQIIAWSCHSQTHRLSVSMQ